MKKIGYIKFLCTIFFAIILQTASAKVWYVGNWTGKPTEDVKVTIAEAYTVAAAGDEVWISAGEYSISSITMKNGVSIYGSFAGTENSPS